MENAKAYHQDAVHLNHRVSGEKNLTQNDWFSGPPLFFFFFYIEEVLHNLNFDRSVVGLLQKFISPFFLASSLSVAYSKLVLILLSSV